MFKALVVPAFEVQNFAIAIPKVKKDLLTALAEKTVVPFLSSVWPSGHSPTNYDRWRDAIEPYQVICYIQNSLSSAPVLFFNSS